MESQSYRCAGAITISAPLVQKYSVEGSAQYSDTWSIYVENSKEPCSWNELFSFPSGIAECYLKNWLC